MLEFEAGILRTERRGPSYLVIDLECPDIASAASPGQFVQVRTSSGSDPFLRRTFSICGCDVSTGIIRLAVDVIGRGTAILCSEHRGGTLNLIGPLGKGFSTGPGDVILAAGGIGAAPLLFLADRLAASGVARVLFLMGARTSPYHELIDGFLPQSVRVLRATDDGSLGHAGPVTDLLSDAMGSLRPERVFACGPRGMLASVASVASGAGVPCEVSLEERMACGIGACLGCAVRLTDGRMARSCVDGPVFSGEEVAW